MNVKNKALAIVCLVIICLFGYFLYEGISRYDRSLQTILKKEARHIDSIVDNITHFSLEPYLIRIKHLEKEHPDLVQAFADRDRKHLYTFIHHEYSILRKENKYFETLNFILPDGTILLQVQNPDISGADAIKRPAINQYVKENQQTIAGYDIGASGPVYRIIHPVSSNGRYIGAMEFSISVKQILTSIAKRLNTSVSSLINLDTKEKLPISKEKYKILGDYALITDQKPVFAQIPEDFDFDGEQFQQLEINGKVFLVHRNTVLENFAGRSIGHIVVLQDITNNLKKKQSFIIRTIVTAIFLLGIVFTAIWVTMSSLISRLESSLRENETAREKLQTAHNHLEKRVKERTAELATVNNSLLEEIAERQQIQQHLSEQHEFLNNILESLTNPFYVIDADTYEIVMANEAAYSLSDRPRIGLTCYQLTHNQEEPCSGDNHICALEMVKKTKKPVMVEHLHCGREEDEGRYFEVYAYPIFDQEGMVKQVIEYNIDITDRRKVEKEKKEIWNQLLQAQKMEAVGVLAGGVAHDFNNFLTAIIGNAQLALVKGGEDCKHRIGKYLNQIMNSSSRAVSLVRQLLIFSRQQGMEVFDPIDLNQAIDNILKMLDRLIGEDIKIKSSLEFDLWTIKADKVNLEQVITNLVVNARDAMPDGGEITISTKNLYMDKMPEEQLDEVNPGKYVVLSVADTGLGMSEEEVEKIFKPFYSTKQTGHGTGLGLSIVHGVVKQHGGWINVQSEVTKGTIFNIYLPATVEEAVAEKDPFTLEKILSHGKFGLRYKVLIIEDEADVRGISLQALESMGFTVRIAKDCREAREILEKEKDNLDLIFSDITLPDGNGVELAQEFMKKIPHLKILITSGYPDQRSHLPVIKKQKMHFILKPYSLVDLEKLLWKIFNYQSPPGAT